MPIADIDNPREVEHSLQSILYASSIDAAAQAARVLFVGVLDFEYDDRLIPLDCGDPRLSSHAHLLAQRDGIAALYIQLDEARYNFVDPKLERVAANTINDVIDGEPLLLFSNSAGDQLEFLYPELPDCRPFWTTMQAYRVAPDHEGSIIPRSLLPPFDPTSIQGLSRQIAKLWHDYSVLGTPLNKVLTRALRGICGTALIEEMEKNRGENWFHRARRQLRSTR